MVQAFKHESIRHQPTAAVMSSVPALSGKPSSGKAASSGGSPLRSRPTPIRRSTSVTDLPRRSKQLPLWLRLLVVAQQGSTVVAAGLVAGALLVYSWTVYVDKMVFRTSRELEAIKAETQQITTTNETLKHRLAERAALPESGFRDHQPDQALFLVPAPQRVVEADPAPEIQVDAMPRPLGY